MDTTATLEQRPLTARDTETPGLTKLIDRFWGLFRVETTYDIGVDYRPLAMKASVKLAVKVYYSKYRWDRSFGANPVSGTNFGGSVSISGDALAVAIITEVKALEGRYLRTELDKIAAALKRTLTDRLAWLDLKVHEVEIWQYGAAAEEKKGK